MGAHDMHLAGPTEGEQAAEATAKIYETRIHALKDWAGRRVVDGRPIAPQELVDQINAWFPEAVHG